MNPIGAMTGGVSKAVNGVPGEAAPSAPGAVGAPPLPEPTAGWTDATTAALAALAEFFQKSREGMREVKKAFDASRQAQMAKEVESMREQADEIRTGAVVQGVMLGASATAGAFALATSSGTASEPAAKETPEACRPTAPAPTTPSASAPTTPSAPANTTPSAPANATPSASAPTTPSAPANTTPSAPANATPSAPANPPAGSDAPAATSQTSKWLELGSKTARDFADPVKTMYDARAKECEADGAAARMNAERAKSNGEDIQGMADSQSELAAKAMDAIRAVLDARHAATMAVLSQRG
ncbi:MAG: hypothetical protein HS104_23340 [Polyangiaceae bacterium]|nr:hypothetical protein [Polyangiaceae bacterium]